MRFDLREARIEDLEALKTLHRSTRLSTDMSISAAYARATDADGYYDQYWKSALHKSSQTVLVARSRKPDRSLVGFSVFGAADDYGSIVADYEPLGELHQIYVSQNMHGSGVGTGLYDLTCRILSTQGFHHMVVNVLGMPDGRVNHHAMSFYKARGAQLLTHIEEHKERAGQMFHLRCPLMLHENIGDIQP